MNTRSTRCVRLWRLTARLLDGWRLFVLTFTVLLDRLRRTLVGLHDPHTRTTATGHAPALLHLPFYCHFILHLPSRSRTDTYTTAFPPHLVLPTKNTDGTAHLERTVGFRAYWFVTCSVWTLPLRLFRLAVTDVLGTVKHTLTTPQFPTLLPHLRCIRYLYTVVTHLPVYLPATRPLLPTHCHDTIAAAPARLVARYVIT